MSRGGRGAAVIATSGLLQRLGIVQIPDTVDFTGATDVSAQLQAIADAAPDNSTILGRPAAVYRCDFELWWDGRLNLNFDGRGCTITERDTSGTAIIAPYMVAGSGSVWNVIGSGGATVATFSTQALALDAANKTTGYNAKRALIRMLNAFGCTFTNLHLVGANLFAGTSNAASDLNYEHQHGFDIQGSQFIEVGNCTVTGIYGDFVYVAPDVANTITTDWYVHDCVFDGNGRMGISNVGSVRGRVINNTIRNVRETVFDLEPNGTGISDEIHTYLMQGNTIGPFRLNLMSAVGQGAFMDDVTFDGQIVLNPAGDLGGLLKILIGHSTARRSNFRVINNVAPLTYTASSGGSPVVFQNIDGATVTGNTQAVRAPTSQFATFTSCTGVLSSPNNTPGVLQSVALTGFVVPKHFGTYSVSAASGSAGGKAAVRLAMGQQQPQFNFIASVTSHWDSAGTVSWNRNWNYNTCVETDSATAADTSSIGFGVPGRPPAVFRVAQPSAAFLNHSQDSKLDSDAANLELARQRQGGIAQLARLVYEFDGGWMPWSIGGQTQSGAPNNPTQGQINTFCQGIEYAIARMLAVSPTLKFDLCGSMGYGDPNNIFGHGHTVWDAVMAQLGGVFDGGLISYFDWDAYSNGPPGGSWLQTELDMLAARAVVWGVQIAHGEFGIGGTISPVVSQAPHNWTPSAWGTTFVNWWKSLPASGRGSMGHVEIFDIGGDGVFLDGRGGVLVPNGEGLAFAGAIEAGLA